MTKIRNKYKCLLNAMTDKTQLYLIVHTSVCILNTHHRASVLNTKKVAQLKSYANTHRLVAQSDDVRDRASSTVLHDDPQVRVLKIAAVVLHDIRARGKMSETSVGTVL